MSLWKPSNQPQAVLGPHPSPIKPVGQMHHLMFAAYFSNDISSAVKTPHATLLQDDRAQAQGWGRRFSALTVRGHTVCPSNRLVMLPFNSFLSICLQVLAGGHCAPSLVVAREAGGHRRKRKG